jgi:hypothetical protein
MQNTAALVPVGCEAHSFAGQASDEFFDYTRSVSVNTDPLPGLLATVTSSPIIRASLRQIARPSHVPPSAERARVAHSRSSRPMHRKQARILHREKISGATAPVACPRGVQWANHHQFRCTARLLRQALLLPLRNCRQRFTAPGSSHPIPTSTSTGLT